MLERSYASDVSQKCLHVFFRSAHHRTSQCLLLLVNTRIAGCVRACSNRKVSSKSIMHTSKFVCPYPVETSALVPHVPAQSAAAQRNTKTTRHSTTGKCQHVPLCQVIPNAVHAWACASPAPCTPHARSMHPSSSPPQVQLAAHPACWLF